MYKSSPSHQRFLNIITERNRNNFAIGGKTRIGFGEGTKTKLVQFIEKFKLENNRTPTIMEVADGAKSSTASIRKYLEEGVDFVKTDLSEVGKKGGKKSSVVRGEKANVVSEVSDDLVKQFKDLKFTHISPSLETNSAGNKFFRVTFSGPIKNDFKNIYRSATEENLQSIANEIDDIASGNLYKDKAKKFKTDEQFRKLRRLKDAMYRKKDPYGIYDKLRRYKSEIFPGNFSKEIQIQHGQPKFSTQTLSRFGFIPKDINVSPVVEMTERIRNEKLATIQQKLKSKTLSNSQKADLIEEYNDTMRGLRGQLKGTPAQGLVNFELLEMDQDGNVTKLKDTGFNPKKGIIPTSDEDLSKITKERAEELIEMGKRKIDEEAVRLKLIPADKIKQPEKSKTRDMYKNAFKGEKGFVSTDLLKDAGKGVGKLLTAAGTPLGVVGITAGFGIDPTSAVDRATLGAEAALAPSLVKGTNQLTKNALIRKLFNLGLSPQAAMRAARIASPLGVASLGGEALYQYGKFVKDELERIEKMTPEEREAYNAEQEEQMGIAAANGGLITREAFKDGFDPKKRQTMKILGGLASIPVLGKYIKILGPLAPKVVETVERGSDAVPTFLYDLIAKVKAKGMKFFTGNRADEFEYVYERDGYQVREQGNKITVRKKIDDGEMLDKDMEMELEVDPETGGLTYKEATARPDAEGKLKDVEEYIEDVDLEEMKKYTYDE